MGKLHKNHNFFKSSKPYLLERAPEKLSHLGERNLSLLRQPMWWSYMVNAE